MEDINWLDFVGELSSGLEQRAIEYIQNETHRE